MHKPLPLLLYCIFANFLIINCSAPHSHAASHASTSGQTAVTSSRANSRVSNDRPICVNVPTNLSFCQPLGWGSKMRLPNLLEHQSTHEVQLHASTWQQLQATKCSPDLSLFICSILTPVCLDVVVPPCRSLCLSVKGNCEPIMKRYDYSWPKIIDCNKFPINKDMCISHATELATTDSDFSSATDIISETHSSNRNQTSQTEDINSIKRKKAKKNRPNSRKNSTVSNQPAQPVIESSFPFDPSSRPRDERKQPVQIDKTVAPFADTTTALSTHINETSPDFSYTNQSNVNFIQLFCSTHSEWLIKTKINDLQLFRAQDKRRMKLRFYKQIYGQPISSNSKNSKNNSHIIVHLTNKTLALTYNQKSIHSNLFDNLVASSSISSSPVNANSTHNLMQSYLLAGKTLKNQQRLITMWMLWPRKDSDHASQSSEDRLPNINQNLLQDYKEIKKKGAKVCNQFSTRPTRKSGSTSHT